MELLISEVQKRPELWDKRKPKYKDRVVTNRQWDSVAKELEISSNLN